MTSNRQAKIPRKLILLPIDMATRKGTLSENSENIHWWERIAIGGESYHENLPLEGELPLEERIKVIADRQASVRRKVLAVEVPKLLV